MNSLLINLLIADILKELLASPSAQEELITEDDLLQQFLNIYENEV